MIREATLHDEATLLRMMRNLAEQEPGAIEFNEAVARPAFRQFLSLPGFGCFWVLGVDEKLVGYIILTLGFSFEFHGRDAFIDELYVEPAYRRRGYGRQALEVAERKAAELGVHAVHLEVDQRNDPALELYRSTGYQSHGRSLMTKWLKHR